MSDGLDLTDLTDDQLVGLARLVASEACRRKTAVQMATKDAFIDEAEKLKLAQIVEGSERAAIRAMERRAIEAATRAKVRAEDHSQRVAALLSAIPPENPQELNWKKRRLIARMTQMSLGEGWSVNVWFGNEADRRVYFEGRGGKVSFFYNGTSDGKHAPQSISTQGVAVVLKPELKQIALAALALWARSERVVCDVAMQAEVADLEMPQGYIAAREARIAKEAQK